MPTPAARRRTTGTESSVGRFFLLAYAGAWLVWIPPLLLGHEPSAWTNVGAASPAAAAVLLTWRGARRTGGGGPGAGAGLRDLFRALVRWRVEPVWWVVCLAGPLVLWTAATGLHVALGGTATWYGDPAHPTMPAEPGPWFLAVAIVFAYVLVLSVIGEELGWRGYALPRLLARRDALSASVVLGALWALWHTPLFFTPGALHSRVPALWFVLQILGQTIILTWVYQRTGGSVLLVALLHAAANTGMGVLPVLPLDTGGSERILWLVLGMEWLVVGALVWRCGRDLGAGAVPCSLRQDGRGESLQTDVGDQDRAETGEQGESGHRVADHRHRFEASEPGDDNEYPYRGGARSSSDRHIATGQVAEGHRGVPQRRDADP